MKIFAYYLPQFHCIPENDEWWGKGFTEWTNVKKAKSLFKNHIQPQVPLNNNYYSLDKLDTLKWQERLMNKYKVDGLIFYHYYFKGKKLLEKPAEMLLNNDDINIPFFFCWANHSWRRTWEGSAQMLLEQIYGDEKDWKEHFDYLLPFFKDPRYQKEDNKPIFMVFKPDFEEKKKMFEYFDNRCIENGFDGICIIETRESHNVNKINDNDNVNYTRYIHLREPGSSQLQYIRKIINFSHRVTNKVKRILNKYNTKLLVKFDGNKLYKLMCRSYCYNKNIIRGLFFEWDNTPRHGYRGYIITPVSKKRFFEYMNLIKNEDYVFVNAWNEWAEGMMLEPTEHNKYKYLEWIKEWKEKND